MFGVAVVLAPGRGLAERGEHDAGEGPGPLALVPDGDSQEARGQKTHLHLVDVEVLSAQQGEPREPGDRRLFPLFQHPSDSPLVEPEQDGEDLGPHRVEIVAEHRSHGEERAQARPLRGGDQLVDAEHPAQLEGTRHDPVERRGRAEAFVVVALRSVESEDVVGVYVVLDPGHHAPGVRRRDARVLEQLGEEPEARRVDRHQARLVLDGEAGAAGARVDCPRRPQLSVAMVRQRLVVGEGVRESLLRLQDEAPVVHAPGGEQVHERRLGAAPRELRLEPALRLEGQAEIGGDDAVDVGGEHRERRERPQGSHEHEASRVAAPGAQNSSR